MKRVQGRPKGNGFERDIAKIIIATFQHRGITSEHCYRTPGSGGHRQASKTDPGDLVMAPRLRRWFNFSVECKFYKSLDWHRLLSHEERKGHWSEWWAQCVRSANADVTGPTPLLVFKKNNGQIFCMFPRDYDGIRCPTPYIHTVVNGDRVRVVPFSMFLERVANL